MTDPVVEPALTGTPADRARIIRNLRVLALTVTAATLLAALSMFAPMWAFHLEEMEVIGDSYRSATNVSVTTEISGYGLVNQPGNAPTARFGSAIATTQTPPRLIEMVPVPETAGWLLIAAAVAVAAAATRSVLAATVSAATGLMAYRTWGQLTVMVEDPTKGGSYLIRQWGHTSYTALMSVAVAAVFATFAYLAYMRIATIRHRRKAAADTRGDSPLTTMGWLRTIAISGVAAAVTTAAETDPKRR